MKGVAQLQKNLREFGINADREISRVVNATAQAVRTGAIQSIQKGPKTGRVYERGSGRNLSALHRASAPGEPPATDTGALASSVSVQPAGALSAHVGTSLKYGAWLEFGTQNMAARPWLWPAATAQREALVRALNGLVDRAA